MIVDAALWGIAAYLIFVLIAQDQKRWQLAAWISAGIYFVWDEIISSCILSDAGIQFTNREVSRLVGNDLGSIDVFDAVLSVGLAYGGFVLGRSLFRRATISHLHAEPKEDPTVTYFETEANTRNESKRMELMTEELDQATSPIDQESDALTQTTGSTPKKKGLAIASFVCGLIGGWASTVSIPAVICGHMALSKIKKDPNTYAGKGLAIAGLVFGYLGLILAVIASIMRGMLKESVNSMGY